MSESPVRVSNETRERLRLAAAMLGKTQQEIVDAAVEEYVVRRKDEWEAGLERARKALLEGRGAEYLIEGTLSAEDAARLRASSPIEPRSVAWPTT